MYKFTSLRKLKIESLGVLLVRLKKWFEKWVLLGFEISRFDCFCTICAYMKVDFCLKGISKVVMNFEIVWWVILTNHFWNRKPHLKSHIKLLEFCKKCFGENVFLNQDNVVFVLFLHIFNEKCHPNMLGKKWKGISKVVWEMGEVRVWDIQISLYFYYLCIN